MPDEIEQEQLQAVRDLLDNEPEVRRAPRFSEEDKQQLALAAKAAGLAVVRWTDAYMDCGYHSERYGQPGVVVLVNGLEELWNPRDFGGDTLQLAVRLNMTLTVMKAFCGAKPNYGGNGIDLPTLGEDKGAVLCRAIVMVAAEIGANMQS